MEFEAGHPIYRQIADAVCENIIAGRWKEGERLPSVRSSAAEVQVNPNTMMRSYAYLQEQGVIENRRGLGYFVAPGAGEKIVALRRRRFLEEELPRLFRSMELLGVDIREVERAWRRRRVT